MEWVMKSSCVCDIGRNGGWALLLYAYDGGYLLEASFLRGNFRSSFDAGPY